MTILTPRNVELRTATTDIPAAQPRRHHSEFICSSPWVIDSHVWPRDRLPTVVPMIEAAGGVVWRKTSRGQLEILVIHRPRYQDWSLPKGKLHRRESALDCALREVREETGLVCAVGDELPEARYTDRKGRAKRVRYWAMQELSGTFHPNDEVDKVRWERIDHAAEMLTYDHDLVVVAGLDVVVVAA